MDILLAIHFFTLILTAVCIIYTDSLGALWMVGKKQVLDEKIVTKMHTGITLGLIIMITSGVFLFVRGSEYIVEFSSTFLFKFGFVLVLVVNSFVISHLMKYAFTSPFKDLSYKIKMTLLLSGAVSTSSWIATTILGFNVYS